MIQNKFAGIMYFGLQSSYYYQSMHATILFSNNSCCQIKKHRTPEGTNPVNKFSNSHVVRERNGTPKGTNSATKFSIVHVVREKSHTERH